jgi:hypothetical protein
MAKGAAATIEKERAKAAYDAMKELIRLMKNSDNEAIRLAAACEILDCVCGEGRWRQS